MGNIMLILLPGFECNIDPVTFCLIDYVDSVTFCYQVFEGNVDSYSVKHSYLDEPIVGRFIKFHTVHWNKHPSMRVEIIGCQGQCL